MAKRLIPAFALLLAGCLTAAAQDLGTLNPKPLPPLTNPDDPKTPAKELFGRRPEPAKLQTRSIGYYTHGCLAGGPPSGTYRPERLERKWYSRKYDWSPMPHAIFFHHGFAIHGTNYISRLGRRASHGCVRLHPQHAAILFDLVQSRGKSSTRIVVSDSSMMARR